MHEYEGWGDGGGAHVGRVLQEVHAVCGDAVAGDGEVRVRPPLCRPPRALNLVRSLHHQSHTRHRLPVTMTQPPRRHGHGTKPLKGERPVSEPQHQQQHRPTPRRCRGAGICSLGRGGRGPRLRIRPRNAKSYRERSPQVAHMAPVRGTCSAGDGCADGTTEKRPSNFALSAVTHWEGGEGCGMHRPCKAGGSRACTAGPRGR